MWKKRKERVHIRYIRQYINIIIACIFLSFSIGCAKNEQEAPEVSNTKAQGEEISGQLTEPESTTENLTENPTENFIEDSADNYYFSHKISMAEDENYVYAIDNAAHMLVKMDKKTNEISYLCNVDGCKHEQNSSCGAFVDFNLSADIWKFQDKIYFMSGRNPYVLECVDLISRERKDVMTIESDSVTDFYFTDGNLFYVQKSEDNTYQLIKTDISGESEAVVQLEKAAEHLKITDSSFYYLSEGKLFTGAFTESEVNTIAENVYDYDVCDKYVYYSVSGEGVWKYDLLTKEAKIFTEMELRSKNDYAVFTCGDNVIAYNSKTGLYYMDENGKNMNHVNAAQYSYFYNLGMTEKYFICVGHSAETVISYINRNELETAVEFTNVTP